ncbi:hypothetical protein FDH48_gp71 [Arthrobacter phage Jawnski]|uniref:Uncharacterized protein n=1 Tax=Arthrobacter phage Jawnski TaxID=1772327 RepID=A0A0U4KP00_9CAUD|nr:hypothetical protein FDH48_gp71 [Arthrobacter phage Jawnski]ALY09400.1 hypothetical protein JAWNSKI_71 [Arthrobacter phage Jawnski]
MNNRQRKEHTMDKATEARIIDFIKGIYAGQFETLTVTKIETTEPNKYGEVKHIVSADTVWLDGSKTQNTFSCNQQDNDIY